MRVDTACFARALLSRGIVFAVLLAGCGANDPFVSQFRWSVTPDEREIMPGGQATYDIVIDSKANINAPVALRVEGTPAGATATFNPQNLPDTANSSTLKIQTIPATEAGNYTVRIFAQESGQLEQESRVDLRVVGNPGVADFTLEVDPAQYSFDNYGSSPTFTYFVRPLNGFQGTVTTTISGLTDDLILQQPITPSQVTIGGGVGGQGGTFVIRFEAHPPVPTPVDLTVTASSGAIVHTRTIRVFIPQ